MKYTITLLFLFTFIILFNGCGNKFPLSGRVTYSDDGSALEYGVVCFETSTFLARGEIGKNGKYVVGSVKQTDGIPKGTYNVYVSGTEIGNGLLVDKKYANPQSSGLTFTVDGKNKVFDFTVDRGTKITTK
ncbi:MAG: hypothetical protein LBP59_18925 [Planctomycetaceae bacterium]|jgi:hypothetical protein|nr:hypothetical protein [Planctomycetaceae bacterium]